MKEIKLDTILRFLLKVFIPLILLLLGFKQINESLLNKLSIKDYDPPLVGEILFLLVVILFVCIILYRFIKYRYKPSNRELYLSYLISIFILVTFFLPHEEWRYLEVKMGNLPVCYITLIFVPVLLNLILGISVIIHSYYSNFLDNNNVNFLINDDPLKLKEDDLVDYSNSINHLKELIENSSFNTSFSIGVIGEWGSGKSSFSNLLKLELNDGDFIQINFSPFLVKEKTNIIKSFFNNLSENLSNYNGDLSNQLTLYVNKLLAIYDNGKWEDILRYTDLRDRDFKEVNDKINSTLIGLNRKIIVYIDDLDRLDEKEIIEVLKLLRNSVNFTNVFFIVEMDKEYTINTLSSTTKEFIDKFFQLEVSIPKTSQSDLIEYFISEVSSSKTLDTKIKESILENIKNSRCLFNDYIKNYRSLKRFFNQIVFESKLLEHEIEIVDFMNFLFLKMKFPNVIKILDNEKETYFDFDDKGNYVLKAKESSGLSLQSLGFTGSFRDRFYIKQDHYNLYTDKLEDRESSIFPENLDIKESNLLLRTLIHLFGNENKVEKPTSIKTPSNFRKLMQQKISKEDITIKDFEEIIFGNVNTRKIEEFNSKQVDNLLNHLDYFIPSNDFELKNMLDVLFYLWEIQEEEDRLEYKIEELVFKKIRSHINRKEIIFNFIINDILSSKRKLSNYRKMTFLLDLRKQQDLFDLIFKNKKGDFMELLYSILIRNLDDLKKSTWSVRNYNFYRIFHGVKDIATEEYDFKEIIRNFLLNLDVDKIQVFVSQVIDSNIRDESMFILSNVVDEIFGSKGKFIEVINNHEVSKEKTFKEVLFFFKLSRIVKFSKYIIFKFKENKYMMMKYDESLSRKSRIVQIFLETNSKTIERELATGTGLFGMIYGLKPNSYLYFEDNGFDDYNIYLSGLLNRIKEHFNEDGLKEYNFVWNDNSNNLILENSKGEFLKLYYATSSSDGKSTYHI